MALTKAKLEELITAGDVDPLVTLLAGKIEIKLLWTNPSPSNSVSGVTYDIDSDGYDMVLIRFRLTTTSSLIVAPIALKHGESGQVTGASSGALIYRNFGAVTTSQITFGTSYSANTHLIPYEVYGIRCIA